MGGCEGEGCFPAGENNTCLQVQGDSERGEGAVLWRRRGEGRGEGRGSGGALVEQDAALNGLAADGTLAHTVSTQLAGAVAAHEDHVLQPVQAHRAHGLRRETQPLKIHLAVKHTHTRY